MNLKEIRDLFVDEASGRTDLRNTDGTDNGANKFINMGLAYLEDIQDTNQSLARYVAQLQTGQYFLETDWAIAITDVWITQPTGSNVGGKILLSRKTERWIRENFIFNTSVDSDLSAPGENAKSDSSEDTPSYWAPRVIRLAPEQANKYAYLGDSEPKQNQFGFQTLRFGETSLASGVIVAPAADQDLAIEVEGFFMNPPMVKDTDKNFWSERYPDLLVFASAYKLETFYRNTQGANDWLASLNTGLKGIENGLVKQESANMNQIGG